MDFRDVLALINVCVSSGVLWKMFVFAANYGKLTEKVDTHDREIERLRDVTAPIKMADR